MQRVALGLALGALLLVIGQLGAWTLIGRANLPVNLAAAIEQSRWGDIAVNWECLREMSNQDAEALLKLLDKGDRVWQEHDVPAERFEVLGYTGDGKPIRAYQGVQRLCVTDYHNNPIYGSATYQLVETPLSAESYQVRWAFVLGYWVRLGEQELLSVS